jgi:transcriptional antiterminator NusG
MMAIDKKQLSDAMANAPTDRQSAALDKARAATRRTQALLAAAGEEGPQARWYVLTIRNGFDKAVDKALTDAGIACWMPTRLIEPKRRGGRPGKPQPPVMAPALPGYLFVHTVATACAMAGLMGVEGVDGVLGGWERPASVKDGIVLKLRAFIDDDPEAIMILSNALRVDEEVLIDSGPFASFPGVVVEAMDRRVLVEVMIFGRRTPVELDIAQVSKL